MPPGRKQASPAQKLVLRTIMVGFVCFTTIGLYKSCSTQQKEHQNALDRQAQAELDAQAKDAEARKKAAELEMLRLKQQNDQETNDKRVRAAQLEAQAAEKKERDRKEGEALKALHVILPEGQSLLLSVADKYSVDDPASVIMRRTGDDSLTLLREPALPQTSRSDYSLRWSSGVIKLEELVDFDAVGRPIVRLVEKRSDLKAGSVGWNNVEINTETKEFKGDYACNIGFDGFSTRDLSFKPYFNLNFTVAISQIDRGSPAEKAGLESGDIILQINGEDWANKNSDDALRRRILLPNEELSITVFRPRTKTYDLARVAVPNSDSGDLGMKVQWQNQGYGCVAEVYSGTPAADAGIRFGDCITSLNGDDVAGMELGQILEKLAGPPKRTIPVGVQHILYLKLKYNNTRAHQIHVKTVLTSINSVVPSSFQWRTAESLLVPASGEPLSRNPIPRPVAAVVEARPTPAQPVQSSNPPAPQELSAVDAYLKENPSVIRLPSSTPTPPIVVASNNPLTPPSR